MSDATDPAANPEAKANPAIMSALLGTGAKPTPPQTAEEPDLDEDGLDDEDGVEGEEQEDETPEDELPQAVRDILTKNRKELREAKAEARNATKELAALKNGDPSPEVEAAKAGESTYKDLYLNSSAKTALATAGLTSGLDRLVRLIDFSEVTIEENGTITGLDDQITGLKEDFPDMFTQKAPTVRRTGVKADVVGRTAPPAPKSSASKLTERMMGM